MTLAPISMACPRCGSRDVIYSCKPECCFNHVCNNCYTTFEPVTNKIGELKGDLDAGVIPPDADPSDPTAACARCGESRVFAIIEGGTPSGQLVCSSCKALLTLELSAVAPG